MNVWVGLGMGIRTQVGVPAEPASVAGIDVHGDIGEIEVLQGVGDSALVVRLGA